MLTLWLILMLFSMNTNKHGLPKNYSDSDGKSDLANQQSHLFHQLLRKWPLYHALLFLTSEIQNFL